MKSLVGSRLDRADREKAELNARIARLERMLRESLKAVNEMYGSRHWLARKIRRVLREGES